MSATPTATVLLVDDNELFRELLKSMLLAQASDLKVNEAEDLREGFSKLGATPPDLVVVDIGLPDGNGLDLVEHVKARWPEVQVAICTSYDIEEYRRAARGYGAEHFIAKSALTTDDVRGMMSGLQLPAEAEPALLPA